MKSTLRHVRWDNLFLAAVDVTLKEIKQALACKPLEDAKGQPGYSDYLDLEGQRAANGSQDTVHDDSAPVDGLEGLSTQIQRVEQDVELQLRLISRRLETEVDGVEDDSAAHDTPTAVRSTAPSSRQTTANRERQSPLCLVPTNGTSTDTLI